MVLGAGYLLPRFQRDPPEADKFPLSAVVAWAFSRRSEILSGLRSLTTAE